MAEWCTIESDPGVFTELINNIGVKDVQVEEVTDFDDLGRSDNIYGLIFLFKYVRNSGYEPNVMANYDEDLYFPKQVITNACATQAILGLLLNLDDKIEIGGELTELKSFTKLMDPYMKGLSISNSEKIRIEHNKFSKPEPFVFTQKRRATDEDDVFHYVSYLHFKNSVYEIDGLREGPILIAENVTSSEWVEKVKPAIVNRINLYANNEIKFNLLSLVPNRLSNLNELERDLQKRIDYLTNLSSETSSNVNKNEDINMVDTYEEYDGLPKEDLERIRTELKENLDSVRGQIYEENLKFENYKVENVRRQHNYIPLIFELLKIMGEKNVLEPVYTTAKDEVQSKKK